MSIPRMEAIDKFVDCAAMGDVAGMQAMMGDGRNFFGVDARPVGGQRALHVAVLNNQPDSIRFLIANKADIEAKDVMGVTPLYEAVFKRYPESVRALLDAGADMYHTRACDTSLPGLASGHADSKPVIRLLLKKMDEEHLRKEFFEAAMCGRADVMDCFLELEGFDIHQRHVSNEQTALILVVRSDNPDIARTLAARGMDVNAKDINGNTALMHLACFSFATKAAFQMLLDLGADVFQKNNKGETAYDLALQLGYADNAAFLNEARIRKNIAAIHAGLKKPMAPLKLVRRTRMQPGGR